MLTTHEFPCCTSEFLGVRVRIRVCITTHSLTRAASRYRGRHKSNQRRRRRSSKRAVQAASIHHHDFQVVLVLRALVRDERHRLLDECLVRATRIPAPPRPSPW
jgi:hypothetical protein